MMSRNESMILSFLMWFYEKFNSVKWFGRTTYIYAYWHPQPPTLCVLLLKNFWILAVRCFYGVVFAIITLSLISSAHIVYGIVIYGEPILIANIIDSSPIFQQHWYLYLFLLIAIFGDLLGIALCVTGTAAIVVVPFELTTVTGSRLEL